MLAAAVGPTSLICAICGVLPSFHLGLFALEDPSLVPKVDGVPALLLAYLRSSLSISSRLLLFSCPVQVKADIVWQNEMERGFSKMMQAMEVYLQDGAGWDELKASTNNYAP